MCDILIVKKLSYPKLIYIFIVQYEQVTRESKRVEIVRQENTWL